MKKFYLLLCFLYISLLSYSQIQFTAGNLSLEINNSGTISALVNKTNGKNYLHKDTTAPLLTLVHKGKKELPASLSFNKKTNTITLQYTMAKTAVDIKVQQKNTYLVFEIVKAAPQQNIDAVIWGPLPTTITKTVGEVIGVVRDEEVAIGMYSLNTKTLGGDYPNSEGSTWVRGLAAKAFTGGSSLQCYSLNRNNNRFVDAWGGVYKNMPVKAIPGETVTGSKIALFSCSPGAILNEIETITLAEKLPYPTIKGTWTKKSAIFGKSYLISAFDETNVDEMIAYTKKAGLISLYHEGPFKNWGHYLLDSTYFSTGKAGLKKSVDKAHAAGLFMGVHTLSNFINTNDAYVTPVPDDRLSVTGSSVLINDIDASQKEIEVASPEYFNDEKGNNLHTVKIGKELIRYKSVTAQAPYKLLDCQRGAFGTTISSHKKNETVGKLFDHPYNVFFPDINLQQEIASNLITFFNETGVDHADFDGFEGCLASGQGDYALEMFAKKITENVKHDFILGTSTSKTFFWNECTNYNWGEPWYGGFNESMQQYRIDNQAFFDRNLMPRMLGWYLLKEYTTLQEMEWMLARAAAYDAGFAMVAQPSSLRSNSNTNQLLDAIREWELARNSHAFSAAQRETLKNTTKDFHLDKIAEGQWNLSEYNLSPLFIREKIERQPGEPTFSNWEFKQQSEAQPLQFTLKAAGKTGSIKSIKLQLDNYIEILLPFTMNAGEQIICNGTEEIILYNKLGAKKESFRLPGSAPIVNAGKHTVRFDCLFEGDETPKAQLQFKQLNKTEKVVAVK